MILVVGGTSLIGKALIERAASEGVPCAFTTRRSGAEQKCGEEQTSRLHFLDLNDSPDLWQIPSGTEHAILCAATTGLAACENDPGSTRAINVSATIALADRFAAHGVKVTFLSSNQVFGSDASAPAEDSEPSPTSEYGRQKLAVERHLLDAIPGSQIIRLTKVISPAFPLFAKWAAALAADQPIAAYSDLYFSAIALDSTAAMILKIASGPHSGVFHISASDSISYLDAARWLAEHISADSTLVKSVPAPSPNSPDACRLSCERTVELVGYCLFSSIDHLPIFS
jgi:dTDP-4-dehydrorhamnose reductase